MVTEQVKIELAYPGIHSRDPTEIGRFLSSCYYRTAEEQQVVNMSIVNAIYILPVKHRVSFGLSIGRRIIPLIASESKRPEFKVMLDLAEWGVGDNQARIYASNHADLLRSECHAVDYAQRCFLMAITAIPNYEHGALVVAKYAALGISYANTRSDFAERNRDPQEIKRQCLTLSKILLEV